MAQAPFFRRTQLSDGVQVDEANSATLAHLERIDALLGDKQFNEVVDLLSRMMSENGDKLIALAGAGDERDDLQQPGGSRRYMPLSQWCQMRLALLADEAPQVLRLYRARIDPLAKRWYEQAMRDDDEALLKRIADELFCSSYGDDALFALGEIALERGQPATARAYWGRLSPQLRAGAISAPSKGADAVEADAAQNANARPLWNEHLRRPKLELKELIGQAKTSPAHVAYPDTDLNLAEVRARLALASIYEGSLDRAAFELEVLQQLHPGAKGKLNGKTVDLHAALAALLEESRRWPARAERSGWPTFAANADRNAIAPGAVDVGGVPAWSFPLGQRLAIDESSLVASGIGARIGESADGLLSVHPIVVGDVVWLSDIAPAPQEREYPHWMTRVRAYDLRTGQPAWPKRGRSSEEDEGVVQQSRPFVARYSDRFRWGAPRLTMSSRGRYVFARIGSPVTMRPGDDLPIEGRDQIVALDLEQQGKLLWEPISPHDDFAFEGPPISDGDGLYVALRRSQTQPQSYVAAYDLKTGQPRWRTWLSAAESPALGRSEEVTHNLLTLHDGVIYCNTNLGAVAAVEAASGKIKWLTVYQRANFDPEKNGEPASNFQRDLNPCVYWNGLLLVAPSDSHDLLCLEAATGQLLWSLPARDIIHLLGVSDDGNLLAGGNRLWWIDAQTGRTLARFPASNKARPHGYGRGILAGGIVYWPTHDALYVFDQNTARQVRQPIDLARRGLTGGNILVAGGQLLITTADKVVAFRDEQLGGPQQGGRGASAP